MASWHEKSKAHDLFFCTNTSCNVITFKLGPSVRNMCPKCFESGALVRNPPKMDEIFDSRAAHRTKIDSQEVS